MMIKEYYIYPGRFHPFHWGVGNNLKLFRQQYPREPLHLGIIFNHVVESLKNDDFEKVSAEHQLPERNPFSLFSRMQMAKALITELGDEMIFPFYLPRPSRTTTWEIIQSMFPGRRIWVVPDRGDTWDARKATFFQEMGDSVFRIEVRQAVRSYDVRKAIEARDFDFLRKHVPQGVLKVIFEML